MNRLRSLFLILLFLLPLASPAALRAQSPPDEAVARLMADMSGAEKVGQLFLVTFSGATVAENSAVAALIRDYHIGGVLLLPQNGNVVNEGDTPAQVAALITQLQQTAWSATRPATDTATGDATPFIPLFVAVHHEGNGAPFTGIVNGLTPLPSQMALGATWKPAYAEAVGQIAGRELSALGINMLLGPSLDVVDPPRPQSTGDLGVRVFGGEPFWVGQMGRAYIRGVHAGSNGRVAVIAKHFPGLGTSDRSLDEEVSTVQRTLDKLRQVDLLPFAAVMQAEDPWARPDGVLVSHIRFRGLEGGRFTTTGPVSVDGQVLQRLLGLPEVAGWRAQGGLTVSDSLGLRALRRFYDPKEESFKNRRIAQDAFLAGNDILLLSQFALGDNWEERIANVESTITFFREKYEADLAFQALVDAAVARILRLKLALYGGDFDLAAVLPDMEGLAGQLGTQREVLPAIARDAVTLLSPPSPDLFMAAPTFEDRIVIFTDSRQARPCATCAPIPSIDPLALRNTIVKLYGPNATGQVNPLLINSFTFKELESHLSSPPPPPTPTPAVTETVTPAPRDLIEVALQNADWIFFVMLNPLTDPPQSAVVQRFLSERAATLRRNPYLVVLACDAPYYLDATEISKLSAYLVAYSRTEPFIETLVRVIFNEFAPAGASPVSVPGINYDLLVQTSPDPGQTLALSYEINKPPVEAGATPTPTPEGQPSPTPTVESQSTPLPPSPKVGDELRLRTAVIVDHNGHPVPDGTPVQFIFAYPREGLDRYVVVTTRGGVAETTLALDRTGQLDISLQADPVPRTLVLQIAIPEGEPAIILTPTPFPPTPTPEPTPTPTPEPLPLPADTPMPTPPLAEDVEPPASPHRLGVMDLLLALLCASVAASAGYVMVRATDGPIYQALRLALWCIIGGLLAYLVYAFNPPGVAWVEARIGGWTVGWMALLGSVMPLIVAWGMAWRRRRRAA